MEVNMVLSDSDSKLFYELWLPLLDYVNDSQHINDLRDIAHADSLNPQKVKEIANTIWEDASLIDDYLKSCSEKLSEEEKAILSSWKKCRSGRFIMERHLKKGSIFISDDNKVYLVSGIITSWQEMFWFAKLPLMVDMTIIPFKNVLITDGLCIPYQISFGPGIRSMLKETYMDAKNAKMIITHF